MYNLLGIQEGRVEGGRHNFYSFLKILPKGWDLAGVLDSEMVRLWLFRPEGQWQLTGHNPGVTCASWAF